MKEYNESFPLGNGVVKNVGEGSIYTVFLRKLLGHP